MADVQRIKILVKTARSSYEGNLTIPQMRKRVSDVLNEEARLFINLTDVYVDGNSIPMPFVSLNKTMIESVSVIDENPPSP